MDTVFATHPKHPLVLALAAKSHLIHRRDARTALELLEQASQLNPLLPHALMLEAQVALEQGDADHAERAVRRVLKIDNEFLPALQFLAELLARTGKRTEAIEIYRRMLELQPGNSNSHAMPTSE